MLRLVVRRGGVGVWEKRKQVLMEIQGFVGILTPHNVEKMK